MHGGAKRSEAHAVGTHQHIAKPKQHFKGVPSVMPRDKGSTCAPDAERKSVLWRMSGCMIGSSAAWQERDGQGSAQALGHVHPLVAVVS